MVSLSQSIEKIKLQGSVNTSERVADYYGSDVFDKLGYKSKEDFESNLQDTFEAFYSNQISVKENFKQVFRFNNGKMYTDWRISPLAFNILKSNPTLSNN